MWHSRPYVPLCAARCLLVQQVVSVLIHSPGTQVLLSSQVAYLDPGSWLRPGPAMAILGIGVWTDGRPFSLSSFLIRKINCRRRIWSFLIQCGRKGITIVPWGSLPDPHPRAAELDSRFLSFPLDYPVPVSSAAQLLQAQCWQLFQTDLWIQCHPAKTLTCLKKKYVFAGQSKIYMRNQKA